jgi:hypothetical protein
MDPSYIFNYIIGDVLWFLFGLRVNVYVIVYTKWSFPKAWEMIFRLYYLPIVIF